MTEDPPRKPRRAGRSHPEEPAAPPMFCPRCGHTDGLIWVHGHGQCAACGSVIEDCCQGAPAVSYAPPDRDDNP